MSNKRQTNINIHRDAWVEINVGNLEHNIKEIRENVSPDMKLLGVVKADAYGHGSIMLAPTILASGVDMLGVASIDEGVDLRQAKIKCDILVLGAVPVWALETAIENNISISIFTHEHLKACKEIYERTGVKPKVHVKLDTGMNRIGVRADEAIDFIKEVQNADYLDFRGIFTHLAAAEELDKTKEQFAKWDSVVDNVDTEGLLLHILNTAGTICYKKPNSNMCRIGISLYGLYPDFPQGVNFRMPKLKQLIYKYYSTPKLAFTINDGNKNGVLDFNEYQSLICDLFRRETLNEPNFALIKNSFDFIDQRKNGVLELNEWIRTFSQIRSDLDIKEINETKLQQLREWECSNNLENIYNEINRNRKLLKDYAKMYMITDGTGKSIIQINNLIEVLKKILPRTELSRTQWKMMVRIADKQGTGMVDLDEFLRITEQTARQMNQQPRFV